MLHPQVSIQDAVVAISIIESSMQVLLILQNLCVIIVMHTIVLFNGNDCVIIIHSSIGFYYQCWW